MVPINLPFLSILSTIFTIQWTVAQVSGEPGYDLKKGPVFYEAYYYPEKQIAENQKRAYRSKAEIGHGTVLERSFQVPSGFDEASSNFDTPRENLGRDPQRNYRSTYPTEFKEKTLLDNKAVYQSPTEFSQSLPNSDESQLSNGIRFSSYPFRIEYPQREYHHSEYPQEYNLENIRFPIIPNAIYVDNINARRNFGEGQVSEFPERESWNLRRNFQHGSYFPERLEEPVRHEMGTFREFGSPTLVRNEMQRELELENVPITRNRPEEFGSVSRDLSKDYQNANPKENSMARIEGRQNFEYDRLRGIPDPLQENIFEPRPQVIRYVFSTPRQKESEKLHKGDLERPQEEKSNFIDGEVQKRDETNAKSETGIASIEVSEIPRHKIRHHHGERPKRNYSQH